ncbi:membrane protein [Streptomyces fulvoviolaceus]|uniref:membrane protein n=1 Tax=Streptomyces fulvoviolaceus TaxID=285535 RepID=UPI0004C5C36D|nr:membrane protein [Streptomyces fulvoviolaceus]
MTGIGVEAGAQAARSRALAVLRIRSRALAVALLPAAVAVVLLAGGSTGHLVGRGWDAARVTMTVLAVLVLLAACVVALVVARARPAVSPTVQIAEETAPDLYRMVRDLADRLDVPAPSAIALTPDCDSWLEDRTHPAHSPPAPENRDEIAGVRGSHRRTPAAPVLVIGSPFLWWMRVGELRAVLAPVVAGTGPSAHPDIAAARRFVRGLDAAVAVSSAPGRGLLFRVPLAGVGWVVRLLLRSCRVHAAEMERGVAAAAAERAQAVDYGLRIVAQEQVGLAYAGWDRLLTRVALPAWRMGRWPSRLDAGVVAALTELSRRDRLAEGFASRLGERPACDLLEEPGAVDEATSLLAARLFHGGPAETGPDWAPVDWQEYPEEVVDRKWRIDAARLHRVLDAQGVSRSSETTAPDTDGPTLSRVLDHLSAPQHTEPAPSAPDEPAPTTDEPAAADGETAPQGPPAPDDESGTGATGATGGTGGNNSKAEGEAEADEPDNERSAALAAALTTELAREEASAPPTRSTGQGPDTAYWDDGALPLFPLQPPRTARELLTDHVTAMVCCAAMDTAGATPGLDWLDGPSLLINGERAADLTPRVLSLVEDGDPAPLRAWLLKSGIRPEKPVRLV